MNDPGLDPEHERLRILVGGYALGQLDDDEARLVERHLVGCAACRRELDEIGPAAVALAELRSSRPRAEADLAVPAELSGRVLAGVDDDVRRERRRWTRRTVGLTSVAAAVAGVVVVGGVALTRPDQPRIPLEQVSLTSTAGVRATAAIVPHTWGVEVKLHARGFVRGERYVVSVQGTDGSSHEAGEFVGTGRREMDCNLNSSVLRANAAGFQVRDPAGDVLVTSRF